MTDTSVETVYQAQDVSRRAVAVQTYTGQVLPAQPNPDGTKKAVQLMPYAAQRVVTPAAPEVPLDEKIRLVLTKAEGTCRTHALREALHLCTQRSNKTNIIVRSISYKGNFLKKPSGIRKRFLPMSKRSISAVCQHL